MFINVKFSDNNFQDSINKSQENTLLFENCSDMYTYEQNNPGYNSSRKLRIYENRILNKYIPLFKQYGEIKLFTDDEIKKYQYRPKRLSLEYYGTIDFWWIILAVNGYMSILDFKNFSSLIIPDKDVIIKTVDEELRKNKLIQQ